MLVSILHVTDHHVALVDVVDHRFIEQKRFGTHYRYMRWITDALQQRMIEGGALVQDLRWECTLEPDFDPEQW